MTQAIRMDMFLRLLVLSVLLFSTVSCVDVLVAIAFELVGTGAINSSSSHRSSKSVIEYYEPIRPGSSEKNGITFKDFNNDSKPDMIILRDNRGYLYGTNTPKYYFPKD